MPHSKNSPHVSKAPQTPPWNGSADGAAILGSDVGAVVGTETGVVVWFGAAVVVLARRQSKSGSSPSHSCAEPHAHSSANSSADKNPNLPQNLNIFPTLLTTQLNTWACAQIKWLNIT